MIAIIILLLWIAAMMADMRLTIKRIDALLKEREL